MQQDAQLQHQRRQATGSPYLELCELQMQLEKAKSEIEAAVVVRSLTGVTRVYKAEEAR